MKKKVLLFSLLAVLFVACGDTQISTNDFKGNCKVIGKTKFDMNRLSDKDQEEFKQFGVSQIDVIVVKTIDVDEPEIHQLSPSFGARYAMVGDAMEAAKTGEVYYIDVLYHTNNPIGQVSDFAPTKSYGIPLGRNSYAGKAEVIDIITFSDNQYLTRAVLKTLDTEKPYLYHLTIPATVSRNDEARKNLQDAETGKTYYMEVSFTTSSLRTPTVSKFSLL